MGELSAKDIGWEIGVTWNAEENGTWLGIGVTWKIDENGNFVVTERRTHWNEYSQNNKYSPFRILTRTQNDVFFKLIKLKSQTEDVI